MSIESLLAGHQRFRARFVAQGLAERSQTPGVLWIGCCDARVIPEEITGAAIGELFVVRNIANLVPPFGTNADAVGAAVEYAVRHLHVTDAVICGHTGCAGLRALVRRVDMGQESHLARWVEWARPAETQVAAAGVPEEAWDMEAAKANVLWQRRNLGTYWCVREAVAAGALALHAWLYELGSGNLLGYEDESQVWRKLSDG